MKALIWALRIVLGAVLVVCIGASALLLYSRSVKGEDPPALFGFAPFTVENSEMTPSLYPGDCAILRLGSESQPGDIIAFRRGGSLLLRRVVGTSDGQYIVQQEAFGQPDVDLLDPSLVRGVCATYLPGCGTVVEFFYSPIGLAILIVLALVLLVVPIFLTRGEVRLEGPMVDYGGEGPYNEPPRKAPSIAPAVYFEDEAPPPRRQQQPARQAPQARAVQTRASQTRSVQTRPAPRQEAESQPVQARQAPAQTAQPAQTRQTPVERPTQRTQTRRGGSHYKPRH